ncbi:MAG: TIGR02996 domain-containing protein [Syntrophobacteraceae bacterium]
MLRDADFLQAIIASPADDAPRLVYADWLEEHGDLARTEFIRLQCELARLPLSDPHILPMRDREAELLTEHYRAWLGPIVDWTELCRS